MRDSLQEPCLLLSFSFHKVWQCPPWNHRVESTLLWPILSPKHCYSSKLENWAILLQSSGLWFCHLQPWWPQASTYPLYTLIKPPIKWVNNSLLYRTTVKIKYINTGMYYAWCLAHSSCPQHVSCCHDFSKKQFCLLRTWIPQSAGLGSNPDSTISQLCDLGQVINFPVPLCYLTYGRGVIIVSIINSCKN